MPGPTKSLRQHLAKIADPLAIADAVTVLSDGWQRQAHLWDIGVALSR